jgi:flagellar hook-associated protein 3 FlgL
MQRISTLMQFTASEQALSAAQSDMMQAQARIASGKRISVPSDDPGGAGESVTLRSNLAQLDQYKSNQGQAEYLLNESDNALSQFSDALVTVKQNLVAAGNGGYTDADRQALATNLEGVLSQMVGLANTSDGTGGYLFAGTRDGAAPFTQSGAAVSYGGDANAQRLEISNSQFLQTRLTGDEAFLRIRAGNGTFTTAAAATNTGTGVIDPGGVVDPSQITGSGYSIAFDGSKYVVTRSSDGTQFNFPPGSSGTTSLQFDGMSVAINGTPAAGDSFAVQPSGYQSIFDTMAQAISALRTPGSSPAALARVNTALGSVQASVDQAIAHVGTERAQLGSALNEVNGYASVQASRTVDLQTQLSGIEDADMAQAISAMTQKQLVYTAAIQSYSSISKLSLFNYL